MAVIFTMLSLLETARALASTASISMTTMFVMGSWCVASRLEFYPQTYENLPPIRDNHFGVAFKFYHHLGSAKLVC